MAVYATRAKRVTDEMFVAAAQAVAECVTSADLDLGQIFPPQSEIFETELHVAARIAEVIFERGLSDLQRPDEIAGFIRGQVYVPDYRSLV
jgi:malate dehydrogenase (oxaloacetate-decarboxylating)(NADP+)